MIGNLVGAGRTAEVYEWTGKKVIKLFYPHIPHAEVVHEFEKHRLIEENISLCARSFSIEFIDNRYGIVYERVTGISMMQKLLLGTEEAAEIGWKLGKIHREIHGIRIPQLNAMKPSVENTLRTSKDLDEAEKRHLLALLTDLPEDDVLCHMDFHPDNIFLKDDRSTVLDWMTALRGDPLADVARTVMILTYAEIPAASEDERRVIETQRSSLIEGYEKAYLEKHVLNTARLDMWMTIMLASRLSENISYSERRTVRQALEVHLKSHIGE